jgi:uncharacterized membrane protein YhdT
MIYLMEIFTCAKTDPDIVSPTIPSWYLSSYLDREGAGGVSVLFLFLFFLCFYVPLCFFCLCLCLFLKLNHDGAKLAELAS